MINIETAELAFTTREERPNTIFRAELTIFQELSLGPGFDAEVQRNAIETELRRRLQEIVYGELLDAVVHAQHQALSFAHPEGQKYVKEAFAPIIQGLKINLPASCVPMNPT
jgi:hypothetical protein